MSNDPSIMTIKTLDKRSMVVQVLFSNNGFIKLNSFLVKVQAHFSAINDEDAKLRNTVEYSVALMVDRIVNAMCKFYYSDEYDTSIRFLVPGSRIPYHYGICNDSTTDRFLNWIEDCMWTPPLFGELDIELRSALLQLEHAIEFARYTLFNEYEYYLKKQKSEGSGNTQVNLEWGDTHYVFDLNITAQAIDSFYAWLDDYASDNIDLDSVKHHIADVKSDEQGEYEELKKVGRELFPEYFHYRSFYMTTEQFITFTDTQEKDGIAMAFLFLVFIGERKLPLISDGQA